MAYRVSTNPRRRTWFGNYVTDLEWNDAQWQHELIERALHIDAGLWGVLTGMGVTQHYSGTFPTPDLTVDVAAGAARDDAGWRLPLATLQNVDCSVDHLGASTAVGAGQHRCVSVFARFEDLYSEVHSPKSGPPDIYRIHDDSTVLEVWMGAETLLGNPLDYPPLMAGYVLLGDVKLINGQTQIVPADLNVDHLGAAYIRRQDLLGAATPATPNSVRGFSLKAAILAVLGWLNTLINRLVATTHLADGASYVGAEGYAGVPDVLTVGTVRSQLTELNVSVNSRARIAGEAFGGAVSATALESTVGAVTAKTAVIPTAGKDIQLIGETGQGACRNAATALQPFAVGGATLPDHAITARGIDNASASLATMVLNNDSETAFAMDTQEYDNGPNDVWSVANGDRMTAHGTVMMHVDLYGFPFGAAADNEVQYIALKHSSDGRVLAKASTRDANCNNFLHCSIDAVLTDHQYVYAVAYQKRAAAAALAIGGRMTAHVVVRSSAP